MKHTSELCKTEAFMVLLICTSTGHNFLEPCTVVQNIFDEGSTDQRKGKYRSLITIHQANLIISNIQILGKSYLDRTHKEVLLFSALLEYNLELLTSTTNQQRCRVLIFGGRGGLHEPKQIYKRDGSYFPSVAYY